MLFFQDQLSDSDFREHWKVVVPKYLKPVPYMNYQDPNEHIEEDNVKKYDFF